MRNADIIIYRIMNDGTLDELEKFKYEPDILEKLESLVLKFNALLDAAPNITKIRYRLVNKS